MKKLMLLVAGLLAAGAALVASGCEFVTADGWVRQPFEGPGYSMDEGLIGDYAEDQQFVIATTFLPVRADAQDLFQAKMEPLQALLDAGPEGLVGYSLSQAMVGDTNYRTLTVWESQDAMYAFVLSEAHLEAMDASADIAVPGQAKVHSWEGGKESIPPTWEEAIEKLDAEGRSAAY